MIEREFGGSFITASRVKGFLYSERILKKQKRNKTTILRLQSLLSVTRHIKKLRSVEGHLSKCRENCKKAHLEVDENGLVVLAPFRVVSPHLLTGKQAPHERLSAVR